MARQGWIWTGIGVVAAVGVTGAMVNARHAPATREAVIQSAEAPPVQADLPPTPASQILPVAVALPPPLEPVAETQAQTSEAPAMQPAVEELRHQAVLEAARQCGSGMKRILDLQGADQSEQMAALGELMKAWGELSKPDVTGALASEALTAAFDGFMPSELAASEDQKLRFRALYLDLERRREMFGLPRKSPFTAPVGALRVKRDPLTPEQEAQETQIKKELADGSESLLTLQQKSHLEKDGYTGVTIVRGRR